MARELIHPYRNLTGQWLRASFHGHCEEWSACSNVPLAQSVRKYVRAGADVYCLTDHDHVTDLDELRREYPETVFLEGFEYSTRENVCFIAEKVPDLYQETLEAAMQRAGELLTIVCHPDMRGDGLYWNLDKLLALPVMPDGIEIFNGHYGIPAKRDNGAICRYTHVWDDLLSEGYCLWGFANDDFHDAPDFDNAYNLVMVDERTPRAVVAAARQGRCYATTGLHVEGIQVREDDIRIDFPKPVHGRFIGPHGELLAEGEDTVFEYLVTNEFYVRFEARGEAGELWLQPMFHPEAAE